MTEQVIANENSKNRERNRKNPDLTKRKVIRALFIISFIIIPLIHFSIFYVYANASSLIMAFQKPDHGVVKFCGFENFKWVFDKIFHGAASEDGSEDLGRAVINTFLTFGIQSVMLPITMLVAYFVYKKIWGYKTFRVLFYLPGLISSVVTSFLYKEFCGPTGPVAHILQNMYRLDYLPSPLYDERFANTMIFINLIWLGFPGNLILWGGTFSRIPDSVIESAKLDGVSWIREMFQIIIPLVWPTFVLIVIMSLAGIFGASGNVFLLTSGQNGTQTLSNWMYQRVQQATIPERSPNLYRVSAMGLMLTIISCAIAFTVRRFLLTKVEETTY